MVTASQLRPGMILKVGRDLFKVIESDYHLGQGKMPGSVHTKLRHVTKRADKEVRFRPEERLEDAQLQKREMEFLYSDTDSATFMDPETFDQITIPLEVVGAAQAFLQTEMKIPVEFFEGQPVSLDFPAAVEIKVASTAQPVHQQQDNTYKPATLVNGMEVSVPQFIKPGEVVRIEVSTKKYLDRVRTDGRRL
ncbi:MAG TPA: elongation factor P [Terriglobia bacterium]|nr:elongation factor P [Terriglobia bacterium]